MDFMPFILPCNSDSEAIFKFLNRGCQTLAQVIVKFFFKVNIFFYFRMMFVHKPVKFSLKIFDAFHRDIIQKTVYAGKDEHYLLDDRKRLEMALFQDFYH